MLANLRGPFSLRGGAIVLFSVALVLLSNGSVSAANNGDGTMTVNATTAAGGVSGQTFVFDFYNNGTTPFDSGSQLVLTIPAGWTAPQNANAANAGYVTVAEGLPGSGNACDPDPSWSVSGNTITIPQTCAPNDHLTITYSRVQPPVATGPSVFTTQTRNGIIGTLTTIVGSPQITVDTMAITFYKEICPSYGDVPANAAPDNTDETGGHWADLNTSYGTRNTGHIVNPSDDLPAACAPAPGWSFVLREGSGGNLIQNVTTGGDGSYTVYLGLADIVWARGGGVWVNEVLVPNVAGLGSLRCYKDVLNGDNLDYVGGVTDTNQTYCISYNVRQKITFAKPADKTYGDAPFNLGATASSGLPVGYSVTSGPCTVNSSGLLTITGAGTCTVGASQAGQAWPASAGDPPFWSPADPVTQSFIINKATPTCTITPYNVTYDGAAHTATGSCKGVNDEDLAAGLVLTTTHTDVGTYTTDSWAFTDTTGNYTNAGGTITDTITPATAICTVTGYTVTYDGAAHTATGSCSGLSNADLSAGLVLSGTTHTAVGNYTTDSWTFHDATGNYSDSSGIVHDTIGIQGAPTCTITPYNVTYDGVAHAATGTCSGVNDEDLTAGLVLTTTHTAAGDYSTDSWTFHDPSGNYSDASGTLHDIITRPTLIVTADDLGRAVGASNAAFTATITGFVNGETSSVVSGSASLSTTAATGSPAGSYPISVGIGSLAAANYTFTFVDGHLIVGPVDLTIAVNNQTRTVGANNAAFTATITGFVNGNTAADLTTQPTCVSTADASSPVGTYPITCSGAASDNYTFTYVPGTLTITAATPAPTEVVGGETATPRRVATPPVTSINGGTPGGDSMPLFALLICLAFGGLGLLAVQVQRRTMRR